MTEEVRTIPVLSAQSVFNKSVSHLLKQGHASLDAGHCMYRDPHTGDKCAIGCFIPDDLYRESFEGQSIRMLAQNCPPLAPLINTHTDLLVALQSAHDVYFETAEMLKEQLIRIANNFNLSWKVLQ